MLQVLRNSRAMADRLQEHGYSLVSGGAYLCPRRCYRSSNACFYSLSILKFGGNCHGQWPQTTGSSQLQGLLAPCPDNIIQLLSSSLIEAFPSSCPQARTTTWCW